MKDKIILGAKIVTSILLVSSMVLAHHYESSVKTNYKPGSEPYTEASKEIRTYLWDNGCASHGDIVENTRYSWLEVAYITHEMSINGTIGSFDKGICLSYQATSP